MHARLVPKYASLSFALVAIISPLFHVRTNLCICKLFRIKSVNYIFAIVTSILFIFSRRQSVCTKIDAGLSYDESANARSFPRFNAIKAHSRLVARSSSSDVNESYLFVCTLYFY